MGKNTGLSVKRLSQERAHLCDVHTRLGERPRFQTVTSFFFSGNKLAHVLCCISAESKVLYSRSSKDAAEAVKVLVCSDVVCQRTGPRE